MRRVRNWTRSSSGGRGLSLADGSRSAAAELDASPPPALAPAFIAGAERKLLVRLRIATGNWLAAGDPIAEAPSIDGSERFDLALARGDLEEAAAVLDAWVPEPAHHRAALELLIRRAVLFAEQGSRGEALATLADALVRAEPAAQRLPFVQVPAVVSLLKSDVRLATRRFAASIVATAEAVADRAESHQRLVEPLTNREREVLALLPTRLTNAEMAGSLYVSVNALKTHVRHIHLELDAADRDHAVEQAVLLGILSERSCAHRPGCRSDRGGRVEGRLRVCLPFTVEATDLEGLVDPDQHRGDQ